MSKGGRYLRQESKQPRKKGKKIAAVIGILLLIVVVAAVVVGVKFFNSSLDKIQKVEVVEQDYSMNEEMMNMMQGFEEPETTEATPETTEATVPPTAVETEPPATVDPNKVPDILNVLVVGQSFREGEDSRLADTMILVTVNKDTAEVTLTSFLRDTYVDLPDYMGHSCGWNKINTNYALGYLWGGTGGAMEMTNICLKNNFGIEVDYNVEIDFEVFPKIIDTLGGVRINLTEAEAKYLNEHKYDWQEDVSAGENRLFGDHALSYARMRKAEGDADSDIKRTARQRTLVEAIIKKLMSKGVSGVKELADEILPMITTNMTNSQITSEMLDLLPLLPKVTISGGTCPVAGTYKDEVKDTPDGRVHVLVFAQQQQKNLMMPITEGIKIENP